MIDTILGMGAFASNYAWAPGDDRELAAEVFALVRDYALEEAATTVEDTGNEEAHGDTYYAQLGDATRTRIACAANIRAMKGGGR